MLDLQSTFRGVKKVGAGWSARCPAHDDRNASLSIGTGDDGRVLLKCHAGCALDDILAAAHLELADLFPATTPHTTTSTIVATYPYHDEGGRHLYDVVRFAPKDFRQRRADGVWKMNGVRRVLYRLPDLQGQTIAYIPEGEKDADRLHAIGVPGTTNAGGAGKWRPEYTTQLLAASIEAAVIIPDNDEPGRHHAKTVAASCHAAGLKVKIVALPDLPPKGDASDWFDAGHTKDELIALRQATPLYEPSPADVVSTAGNQPNAPRLTRLSDVTAEELDPVWSGRLYRGKFTLFAGDPGQGKSRLTFDSAARITTGALWPDGGRAPLGNVLFLIAEDGIADTVRPAIEAMGGDLGRVFILEGVIDGDTTRPMNLAGDLVTLEQAIEAIAPVAVFIDPITAYLGKTDSYKDAEVRGLLAPVLALIARHRTALCAVAHLAKDQSRAALHRPGGSIAFVAAARLVFVLAADPDDADRRILAPLKSNLCRPAPSLAFRMPEGYLTWEAGAASLGAEELLRPTHHGDPDDATDAEHVIREWLEDATIWPLEAQQALTTGKAQGIPERTLRHTAKRLGIVIIRRGFGKGGRWIWCRPAIPAREPDPDPTPVLVAPMPSMAPMQKQAAIEDIKNIEAIDTCTGEDDHHADLDY